MQDQPEDFIGKLVVIEDRRWKEPEVVHIIAVETAPALFNPANPYWKTSVELWYFAVHHNEL